MKKCVNTFTQKDICAQGEHDHPGIEEAGHYQQSKEQEISLDIDR